MLTSLCWLLKSAGSQPQGGSRRTRPGSVRQSWMHGIPLPVGRQWNQWSSLFTRKYQYNTNKILIQYWYNTSNKDWKNQWSQSYSKSIGWKVIWSINCSDNMNFFCLFCSADRTHFVLISICNWTITVLQCLYQTLRELPWPTAMASKWSRSHHSLLYLKTGTATSSPAQSETKISPPPPLAPSMWGCQMSSFLQRKLFFS